MTKENDYHRVLLNTFIKVKLEHHNLPSAFAEASYEWQFFENHDGKSRIQPK